MHRLMVTICLSAISVLYYGNVLAETEEGPGILRGTFVYVSDIDKNELTRKCKQEAKAESFSGVATDVVVGLAGKVMESIIDAAAAKTQPEATTLETVIPLEAFYGDKGIAINNGCLVIHNGKVGTAEGASLLGVFRAIQSSDATAFRFTVIEWKFDRFLKPSTSHWFQDSDNKDFVLKIEFLSPGAEGLGKRAVFVEHTFLDVNKDAMAVAFQSNQQLPWFAAPTPPSDKGAKRSVPLNIRVTIVETTRPKMFATWIQEIAKNKKTDIVKLVQDGVKKSIDENYAASQDAQSATAAGSSYSEYKAAWDAYAQEVSKEPAALKPSPTRDEQAAYDAAKASWTAQVTVKYRVLEAKKVTAKSAFSLASLPWPGDLPAIPLE